MRKDQFIAFLNNPGKLGTEEIKVLEPVVREFPWFQIARMLYLKALHNTESIQYPSELKKAAYYISDRRLLYKLIQGKPVSVPEIKEARVVPPEKKTEKEKTPEVSPKITAKKPDPPKKVSEFIEEKKKELQKKEGSEEESIADRILAYTKKVKETGEFVSGSDQKKSPESLIEKSLAAEKSGKEKPEEKISEEPQPKEKEVKTPLVSSEETKDTDKIIEEVNKDISEIGDPKSEFEDVAKAEDDITKLSKEFATGALHAGYEIKVSPSEKGSEGHQKEKPDGGEKGTEGIVEKIGLPKKMKLSGWLRALEEGKELAHEESDKPVVTKASMEAIIDKFLDEEPRISKPQKNFFSPVNMAKQSITDDENLVTETLARIYEKQGNYSKAIRTYEILALKYPEKSSYFASLILELKSKNE